MFAWLAISSRNVAIARIERMRTPFRDLQKREEGFIKEALLLAHWLTLVFDAPVLPGGHRRGLPSGVVLRMPPTTVLRSG